MSRGEEEGKRITFGSVDCTVPPRVGQGAFFLSKITNILVGEVWLCSGQSNMEWLVKNSLNAREEIKSAGKE